MSGHPPRVLVVDDAEFSRTLISNLLQGGGYAVVGTAADGYEAVSLYEELAPDLVTLDLVMPGMDGLEALSEIVKAHPDARVVVCSSIRDEDTLIKAISLGARDYVVKPIDPEKLLAALEKALAGPGGRWRE